MGRGIGSFVLQARVSKAADLNQREIEQSSERAELQRQRAATQLEQCARHGHRVSLFAET
jgi:hypothetical protein